MLGQILLVLFNQYDHEGRAVNSALPFHKYGQTNGNGTMSNGMNGTTMHASPAPA